MVGFLLFAFLLLLIGISKPSGTEKISHGFRVTRHEPVDTVVEWAFLALITIFTSGWALVVIVPVWLLSLLFGKK